MGGFRSDKIKEFFNGMALGVPLDIQDRYPPKITICLFERGYIDIYVYISLTKNMFDLYFFN